LLPARQFAAAPTAVLPIAAALFAMLVSTGGARAQTWPNLFVPASAGACDDAEVAVLPSPLTPWRGAPLRVIIAVEKPFEGELSLIAPDGSVAARSRERHGGPPYFWLAEVKSPAAGTWRATLTRGLAPCGAISRDIAVRADAPPRPGSVAGSVWPLRAAWSRATENLFSAWIETLFDAPLGEELSWPALHVGLRDRSRNFLFNHLGLGEDELKMVLRPDCADLPYFLRAYFAFKMGLPFGYAKCTRGGAGEGPKCYEWWNIQNLEEPRAPPPSPPEQIAAPLRPLLDVFGRPVAQPPVPVAAKPQPPARSRLTWSAAWCASLGAGQRR